ncbi:MAG: VOC family protein [Candidatus Nanopelagicales bacterium]|jgi:PhnB protein|nr:VOC family protein [Candidatus Nanopelagicales bacterium]
MSVHLNPYLSFQGTAREAMTHYQRILGGELQMMTFAEFGQTEPEIADLIMHATLSTSEGLTLMGADSPPGMEHRPGNTVTVILHGEDEATLRDYWAGLSEGSTVNVALEPQMWGDIYGQCTDRFGIIWQVDIGTEAAGTQEPAGAAGQAG